MDTLPNRDNELEDIFPKLLSGGGYSITSPKDVTYNCIGWAANDKRWWWPDPLDQNYWPAEAPRVPTPEAFIVAYGLIGYKVCQNSDFEEGYEKIAIYVNESTGEVTHASRQLDGSNWTSKCGPHHDISHELNGLNSEEYSSPKIFMKRLN